MNTRPIDIWGEYQRGLDYQTKMGFTSTWPELINFVEGKQWPPATAKTKFMPRPVINQIDFIVENKSSNILSQSLKMVYSPEEIPDDESREELNKAADDMSDMAQNTWNDIDQDAINEEVVQDVLTLGTGIYHYYFDNSAKGGQFIRWVGEIKGEIIDPMDIFLGNPQLKPSQTQKQPWIIIRTREDVEAVKEQAKRGKGEEDKITADDRQDERYDNAQKDIDEPNKVTCLTKYWKEKGQVYWTKVTENATVQKKRTLAPDGSPKPFTLYPIEILVFKRRKKCTFGRAVIEDLIPNQKALNWGLGMMLLSVQQTAWPKIIAKVGALMQNVTNEPGEILTDHYVNGDGIKYMQPPNFSSMPITLTEKLLDMTRQVTGTTEVNSGEVLGANMAASAIIALQNQAKKPNEAYQNKLFRSIKNIGKIWEEFYKCFYNLPRPISATDEDGNEFTKSFIGSEYADMGFGLSVDVGPASIFNESLQVTVLEKMYDKGDIDKYGYVKYLPSNTVPSELKQDFEKEEEQLMEQQQMENSTLGVLGGLSPEEREAFFSLPPEEQQQFLMEAMGEEQPQPAQSQPIMPGPTMPGGS